VLPAEANRNAAALLADGDAAARREQGSASADVIHAMAEALVAAGPRAREMFVLSQLDTLVAQVAEKVRHVEIKQVQVIEVAYRNAKRLEELENKLVRASGKLAHRIGVETGERTVVEITSIREVKDSGQPADGTAGGLSLPGSEWLLEDLAGGGVLDQVQATLTFLEAGKVGGNGSCNRFFGTAEIHGENVKFGPLGATRMACAEPVMNQETKYLRALQGAERFAWKDPYLVIYCKGFEKPLRFTRMPPRKAAPASR